MHLARRLEADPASRAGHQRHLAVQAVAPHPGAEPTDPPRLGRSLLNCGAPCPASTSRPATVVPRAGGARPRALARGGRLRPLARQPRGRPGLELLRGPADRQRPSRLPSRPRPRLQGRLPALPHDVRLPGAAQGGLGLPRAAGRARGRKAARHLLQAGDRGVRDRRVQPALPRIGLRVRRGVGPADRADRVLDRPRRPLRDARERLHRVGLVVAAPALGRRPPLRGPQGRPLLPALRHGALLARGRAGLQGRRGPLDLRPLPAGRARRQRCRRLAAGLDDDAVDAARQRRRRRRPRRHLRPRRARGRGADPRQAAARAGAGGGRAACSRR